MVLFGFNVRLFPDNLARVGTSHRVDSRPSAFNWWTGVGRATRALLGRCYAVGER